MCISGVSWRTGTHELSMAYLILVHSVIPSEILKTGMLLGVGKNNVKLKIHETKVQF